MFYVLLVGTGEGCDCTIACNRDFLLLAAETMDEAVTEVNGIIEGWGWNDDRGVTIAAATILQVSDEHHIDVQGFKAALRARAQAQKDAVEDAEERAAWERLNKKYGGRA